ncbi:MAG: hypothetical protein M1147_03925 [Nitrospirae bacterium]|nr:hypothetical protein [Nitrospirota bacterium]MCL5977265.1 hypothetical protein [Nitrospirota bacterium]
MILNAFTIIMLFITVLTGVLAIPLGILSFKVYQRWGNALYDEEKTAIINRSYLLGLMATVILFVRLLSWPLFYAALQSYVPDVHGAMCIFGVTRLQPGLTGIVQVLKPLVFFSIGAWLLLNRLDRATETSPLFRRKFLFLSIVSVMIIMDSAGDLIYLTGFDVKTFVSCCTTYFDLPERPTAVITESLLGKGYDSYMLPLYYLSGALFIAFQFISYHRMRKGFSHSIKIGIIGFIIAVINAVITVLAMFEVIAPEVMNMPLHRCIYCMWQYSPHSILMTALFIIGTFSPGWSLILNIAGRDKETTATLERYLKNLNILGIAGIGTSILMAAVHLL